PGPKLKVFVATQFLAGQLAPTRRGEYQLPTKSRPTRWRRARVERYVLLRSPGMADPVLLEDVPSAAEFIELRRIMGSPYVDPEVARKTLSGALFTVCLRQEGRLFGLARVVGDGALY